MLFTVFYVFHDEGLNDEVISRCDRQMVIMMLIAVKFMFMI